MVTGGWKPPQIWKGSTSYILGGGPSLNQVDLSLIHNKHCIGVNNSFLLGPWVDVCWWGDMKWLMWHRSELLTKYHGLVASCNTNSNVLSKNSNWIKFLRRGKPMGIETRPGFVSWNRNSGCSAINLAYHFGSTRIVLVGFDMSSSPSGVTHWHGGHKKEPVRHGKGKMRKIVKKPPYERFRQTTSFIARDAEKLGVEILNASPVSTIEVFPKVKLKDTL